MQLPIQISKFAVNSDKHFVFKLIEDSIEKAQAPGKLATLLQNNYAIQRTKRALTDALRKWQKGKNQIPLDILLALSDYLQRSPLINGLRLMFCRNYLYCSYPILLTKSLAFVSEMIRVEGNLTPKTLTLENTNTEITSKFKEALSSLGIPKNSIKETLHINIQVPKRALDYGLKIYNLTLCKEIACFHKRVLPLKSGEKYEIIFSEPDFTYNQLLIYKIVYDYTSFIVQFKIQKDNKILVESTLQDTRYQKACVSLKLDVHHKTLCYLLNSCLKIPYGKKSHIISIPPLIKNASKNILKQVINATFAAESTLTTKSRFISITSVSSTYLDDFQELLSLFHISSSITRNTLKICGIRNFRKVKQHFDFIIHSKNKQLNELLVVQVEQHQKGVSHLFYLRSLQSLHRAHWVKIKKHAKRTGNSSRLYLSKLITLKCITAVQNTWPREYVLTQKGKILLNKQRDLFL